MNKSEFYKELIEYKARNKLKNHELGSLIDKTGEAFRMAIKRMSLSKLEMETLQKLFDNEQKIEQIKVKEPTTEYKLKDKNYYKDKYIEVLEENRELHKELRRIEKSNASLKKDC